MAIILITSASGANGEGYGAVLSFAADGALTGPFSQDRRITDPRGLSLDPSGELVYLNSGDDRVLALDSGRIDGLDPGGGAFGPDGRYYVGLRQRRTILALPVRLDQGGALRTPRLVDDPELSPLDLAVAPNGNIVVSSEWPYGTRHARASVREYDPFTGRLVSH